MRGNLRVGPTGEGQGSPSRAAQPRGIDPLCLLDKSCLHPQALRHVERRGQLTARRGDHRGVLR